MKNGVDFTKICLLFFITICSYSQQLDLSTLRGFYLGQKPPGTTPEIFAPGIVSTGKEHSAAMFTSDGEEIWFGRMFPEKIYYMKRTEKVWSDPEVAPFCDTYRYLYPVLAEGGQKIFFTSNRPVEPNSKPFGRGQGHIWMVERTPDGWSEPRHLSETINLGRLNSCGSMAANGNLYFTAKTQLISVDLYRAARQDKEYNHVERLTKIDSSEPDHCPFVSPDESYLIFSSFRGGLGRSDLFICFRNKDGTWTDPKNMGHIINSRFKDEYPYVTPDGKYLFFNSNRPSVINQKPIEDGPGNIYWINAKIIDDIKQKELN